MAAALSRVRVLSFVYLFIPINDHIIIFVIPLIVCRTHRAIRVAAFWSLLKSCKKSLGVLTDLVFDSFFVCFCRHRSKMNQKMRSVNLTPLKFSKMRSKMSEKWNNMFFGTLAALNSAARCRLHFILSLSYQPQIFLKSSLIILWSTKSVLS